MDLGTASTRRAVRGRRSSLGDGAKRLVDVLSAGLLLVLCAPVLLLAALAIVLTMGPPVFFRDRRTGIGAREFELVKLRTMRALRPGERVPDADSQRVTSVGRFLRSSSIDELPSLVNVLKGDMSLVGPRPLPVRYLDRYTPHQARRLEIRPGITGWAQVHGRNALSWDERLELDVWYVDHRSLGLDVKILVATVGRVWSREGVSHDGHATMPELPGRDRGPHVPDASA